MFSPPLSTRHLGRVQRILLGAASAGVLLTFGLFWLIEPDPRGYGTHQQFGLPPCSFQMIFGIPCPSCGGTTSVAHFVRGEWLSAGRANAAGFLLCLCAAVSVPWGLASSWQGRLLFVRHPTHLALWTSLFLSGLALVQWGVRLFGF